jgi:uncharacterized protein YbaP (TraB family)
LTLGKKGRRLKNEELILESLLTLTADASKTSEAVGSFAAFLAKRTPGLTKREQQLFVTSAASLLTRAKEQQKQIAKLETALKQCRDDAKTA